MTKPSPAPPGDDLDAAILALREFMLATLRFRQLVAEQLNLDLSASVALGQLSARGPLGARQLADLVGVTPSSMTALLDRLETQDLAHRGRHPSDRRKTVLTITEHGQQSLARVRGWLADALRGIEPLSLSDAASMLAAITEGLDEKSERIRGDQADQHRAAQTHPSTSNTASNTSSVGDITPQPGRSFSR